MKVVVALITVLSAALPLRARAQLDPAFATVKLEEVKPVDAPEWKANAKAGFVGLSGNARATTITVGAFAARRTTENLFTLEGNFNYVRSSVLTANDDDASGDIGPGELHRTTQTPANAWQTKGRYDRFFTPNDAAYVAGLAGADKPAGKRFAGGGQAGYSRRFLKTDYFELRGELAYDFTYEDYLAAGVDPVSIHSGRVFAAGTYNFAKNVSAFVSSEVLSNLNRESAPDARRHGDVGVHAFKDVRWIGKAGITTVLRSNISFNFLFTLKYDNNPAPLAAISGAPAFAPGFIPFAYRTDTSTEATLTVTFL